MPFEKGKRHPNQGGKRTAAGRKSNQQKATEAEATRIVQETLAACFGELIELAKKVCRGVKRRKHNSKTGETYYETEYDTATLRFLIERFIPPAKTTMDMNVNSPDEDYRKIQEKIQEARRLVEERRNAARDR
jgi:hypothetical protein